MRQPLHLVRRLSGALLLGLSLAAGAGLASSPVRAQETADAGFQRFVQGLWPAAKARGVSRATFDEAFRGVEPDAKIVALTRKQSEFVRPIWDYIEGSISAQRLKRGQEMAAEWSKTLGMVEKAYGVPRSVVLGVWGMETNFGSFTGSIYAVRALATLAYTGYRGDFFREELLTALQILEQDHVDRSRMLGSWAGAMGQTQFMPSSFMKYAVDGNGDGVRDIWSSVPDAMASTANYLRQQGWEPGLPWGFEVQLPKGFDFRHLKQNFAQWQALGLRRVDGKAMPRAGEANLFLPGGADGPAFLVTRNYDVIKTYNSSDAYAMGVAHLGDRLMGGLPIQGAWPKDKPMLDKDQRQELQERLARLGFYEGDADGKLGSKTREAVRNFQLRRGLIPDGYADYAVLRELRTAR
ncbi:lytic murein transglycosylase [Microvirga arsenatis]|uniref:Lytic murein transglycosylase n=1 Tax=Microvirga arsenatis TaxID=2692265 RepID=A0ABW9Z1K8_9HYPH|nr:lytic murein transglycosylase [Microvirga arsenatis]NBJ12189.1 lytic murein transglycosylase [Microvirga arsenatis]NBJ25841.1 lytic murein transglycosylase [Microvirga arsenatis]